MFYRRSTYGAKTNPPKINYNTLFFAMSKPKLNVLILNECLGWLPCDKAGAILRAGLAFSGNIGN